MESPAVEYRNSASELRSGEAGSSELSPSEPSSQIFTANPTCEPAFFQVDSPHSIPQPEPSRTSGQGQSSGAEADVQGAALGPISKDRRILPWKSRHLDIS